MSYFNFEMFGLNKEKYDPLELLTYKAFGIPEEMIGQPKSAITVTAEDMLRHIQDTLERTKPESLQYAKAIFYNPNSDNVDIVIGIGRTYEITVFPSDFIPLGDILIVYDENQRKSTT